MRIMRKKPTMVLDPATGKNITVKGWGGRPKEVKSPGLGDVECCEEQKCSEFEIRSLGLKVRSYGSGMLRKELSSLWKLKPKPEEITGNTLKECCRLA